MDGDGRQIVGFKNSQGQEQRFAVEDFGSYAVIVEYLSHEVINVEIPAEINGKPVAEIGEECFFENFWSENDGERHIETVRFPDTLRVIGPSAFVFCKELREVIIPEGVTEIGRCAFQECRSLRRVVIPGTVKAILEGTFAYCHLGRIEEFTIGEGVQVIEATAFTEGGSYDLVLPASATLIPGDGGVDWGAPNLMPSLAEGHALHQMWPHGAPVKERKTGRTGRISSHLFGGDGCEVYELELGGETRLVFLPCDFLDKEVEFVEPYDICRLNWKCEKLSWEEKRNAYAYRRAWEKLFL
ncbi:Leucine rich repeat-containing protein [Ruminococcaceae bacterium YRB3002]|nr:Leucine rich repeat-containing protein [Ruminococcaceae bacterium YRB3002]